MGSVLSSTPSPFPLRANPHLYEINTWPWLDQLSARLGRNITLGQVPDTEWDALARKGFDIVWLMGVWKRSEISRQIAINNVVAGPGYAAALPGWTPADVVGSPYSIAQYIPDPRLGTERDI